MPRNFSTSDAETVAEVTREREWCHDAVVAGQCVYAVSDRDMDHVTRVLNGLMTEHGWYVAVYERHVCGDKLLLAPVREVPGDD